MKFHPFALLFLSLTMGVSLNVMAENTLRVRPQNALKNILQPFTTDRCSYSLDGTWTDCCLEHDYGYWQGGTEAKRLEVDETFRQCMEKATDVVTAGSFFRAVRWFGGSSNASFRWGYGWKYPRALRALNEEELMLVKRTPFNLEEARNLPASKAPAPLPFPSASGNVCLDEVIWLLYQTLHIEVRTMNYTVHTLRPLEYQVSFPEIPGRVYLATMALDNESPCLAPRWSEEPTHYLRNLNTLR